MSGEETDYLSVEDLLEIATSVIGELKVRDMGLLAAAAARPRITVFGDDAYPTFGAKAAALRHSLVRPHALADGTIDCVATDHAPHPVEAKETEWAVAAMGMIGLETALPVVQEAMVETGLLDWAGVAERMSAAPARIGRLSGQGRPVEEGSPAIITLYDPSPRRAVDPSAMTSKSRNTPFAGLELPGRVVATFLRGRPTVLEGKLQ